MVIAALNGIARNNPCIPECTLNEYRYAYDLLLSSNRETKPKDKIPVRLVAGIKRLAIRSTGERDGFSSRDVLDKGQRYQRNISMR